MPRVDPKDKETFEAMVATVQEFYPKYKVVSKKSSWHQKFIGWLFKTLGFNKTYMTRYWTTIGSTVYYPIENYEGRHYANWAVNVHEGNHAGQANRWSPFLFGSLYLLGTPLYAVVFLLLSIPFFIVGGLVEAFPWWSGLIVFGAGLLLSCPVPFGWWRFHWEAQAYGSSIAVRNWCYGEQAVSDAYIERKIKNFTGGDYFFMMPFAGVVRKRLKQARRLALEKKFITQWEPHYAKYYAACYKTLEEQGRVQS
jgi:hypothetical protein